MTEAFLALGGNVGDERATLDRAEYVRGDPLACEAEGRYLYGSPMVGSAATVTLTRSSGSFSIAGLDGFVLHDIEGYEHYEIADMLGIAEGTSKSQLHKARLKLRQLIRQQAASK